METGKNTAMQWKINKTAGYEFDYINAFVQSQSIKKTQIIFWAEERPNVYGHAQKIYGDRLGAYFVDNKFTLKITNVNFNDSGNYSVQVQVKKASENVIDTATVIATVNVHGMFFSYFQ